MIAAYGEHAANERTCLAWVPVVCAFNTEPFGLHMGQLAYRGTAGPEVAYRFEWR